jgi:Bacterial Ig domain
VSNMVLANNAVYSPGKTAVNAGGSFGAGATVIANYVQGGTSIALDNTRLFDGGSAGAAFVNASSKDFWPRTGSILLDHGVAAHAPANDFNSTPRTAPFDVGAYEALGLTANPGWRVVEGFKAVGAAVGGGGGGGTDTSAPSITITAPSPAAGALAGMVSLAASAADNVSIAGVQFRLDGTNLGAELTGAPYSFAWDSTSVTNGTHTLTAVARDTSGNTTTSSPLTLSVTNTAPAPAPPPSPAPGTTTTQDGGGGCTTGHVQRLDPLLFAYCALSTLVLALRRSCRASRGRQRAGRIEQQVEVGMQGDRHPESAAALQARTEQQRHREQAEHHPDRLVQ